VYFPNPLVTPDHRITKHRWLTQPKKRNRCHAMICHQNADDMVLLSALTRSIPPPEVCHFEYYQAGENACHKRAGSWLRGPIWHQYFDDELGLHQNYRKNQEVRLLYSIVSILCPDKGPSLEMSKLSLYFSSSCIPNGQRKLVHNKAIAVA
jgi:hypothetical protein